MPVEDYAVVHFAIFFVVIYCFSFAQYCITVVIWEAKLKSAVFKRLEVC
jgi:hypothetical protein